MDNVPTVGIIGGGFVGGAHAAVFKHYTDVKIYDVNPDRCTHDYADVISQDVIFLCLPTPMIGPGWVDISFVESALDDLYEAGVSSHTPIIIKSTITPEKLEGLYEGYGASLIYSPEFLTERTAELDLQNSTRFIFGTDRYAQPIPGNKADMLAYPVMELFNARFPRVAQHWVHYKQASLIKYFTNAFFACKVSLLNEFYDIAEAVGVDGQDTIDLMLLDQRIGRSHHRVPGHDGKRGFGGTCFPKDLNGLIKSACYWGAHPTMLRAAWETNLRLRPERDWERDVGRAVSFDEEE